MESGYSNKQKRKKFLGYFNTPEAASEAYEMAYCERKSLYEEEEKNNLIYPSWAVTDVRFPNEAQAIKNRGGILIRVERNDYIFDDDGKRIIPTKEYVNTNNKHHESETSLDNYEFNHVIENNGTIEELIEKVKKILIKENII